MKYFCMKNYWFLLTSFIFALPLRTHADQLDARLDELFQQLLTAENPTQTVQLETLIWQIWVAHDNPEFATLMQSGIDLMNNNELSAALQNFNHLIDLAPDFAEAWNKRATINFLLQDYPASEADIARTLALEPFHFGALSGLGLVYMAQGKYRQAQNAFQAALEVNPSMLGVKNNLQMLDDYLRSTSI